MVNKEINEYEKLAKKFLKANSKFKTDAMHKGYTTLLIVSEINRTYPNTVTKIAQRLVKKMPDCDVVSWEMGIVDVLLTDKMRMRSR